MAMTNKRWNDILTFILIDMFLFHIGTIVFIFNIIARRSKYRYAHPAARIMDLIFTFKTI